MKVLLSPGTAPNSEGIDSAGDVRGLRHKCVAVCHHAGIDTRKSKIGELKPDGRAQRPGVFQRRIFSQHHVTAAVKTNDIAELSRRREHKGGWCITLEAFLEALGVSFFNRRAGD